MIIQAHSDGRVIVIMRNSVIQATVTRMRFQMISLSFHHQFISRGDEEDDHENANI